MVREAIVRLLMTAASSGMEPIVEELEASGDEVISAYFTLTKSAILAAQAMGIGNDALQKGVQELWSLCNDPNVRKN